MGLVISRKRGEWVRIGADIWIQVIEGEGRCLKLRIEAPADLHIDRGERVPGGPPPDTRRLPKPPSERQELRSRRHGWHEPEEAYR